MYSVTRHIPLRVYAILLISTIVAAFAAIGITQYRALGRIDADATGNMREINRVSMILTEMDREIGYGGLVLAYKDMTITQNLDLYDDIVRSHERLKSLVAALLAVPIFPDSLRLDLDILTATIDRYKESADAYRASGLGGRFPAMHTLPVIDNKSALASRDKITKALSDLAEANQQKLHGSVRRTFILLLVLIGVGAAIMTLVTVLLFLALTRRLAYIEKAAKALASGNLTKRLTALTNDALGRLSRDFNESIEKFAAIVGRIKIAVASNEESGERLLAQVRDTITAATEISASIESIVEQVDVLSTQISGSSASVTEILANIKSMSDRIELQSAAVAQTSASVEEMDASIKSVAEIADQKRSASDNLVAIIAEGNRRVTRTHDMISAADAGIDDVLQMISVINAIAEQTHLLSMNAAIEAAHAGAAGKGFAVVADEIRNLAEGTAKNAKDISEKLGGLVDNIREAQEASVQSGRTFFEIDERVKDTSDALNEIIAGTGELANGSGEILRSVESLLDITAEIKAGSIEMEAGAEGVNTALVKIQDVAVETRNAVGDIGLGAADIRKAARSIAEVSEQNAKVADELVRAANSFAIADSPVETPKKS